MSDLYSCRHNPRPTKPAERTPFAGVKILLVEDNPVNLKLAKAILELLGCIVVAADSGEKAIELLRSERDIALALMDCQMPGLDGFETTLLIRTMQDKGEISRMPIIAVTALSLKGDRERCLEIGMDDYLPKPLHKKTVQNMLAKWLAKTGPANVNNRHLDTGDDIELVDTPCLDRQMLDDVRALMGGKFKSAVQLYIEDTDDRICAIERILAVHGDTKNIVLQAHSIKSSSAHMGAARLAAVAGTMEMSAQDAAEHHKNAASLAPLLQEIRAIFAETQKDFQKLDTMRASG